MAPKELASWRRSAQDPPGGALPGRPWGEIAAGLTVCAALQANGLPKSALSGALSQNLDELGKAKSRIQVAHHRGWLRIDARGGITTVQARPACGAALPCPAAQPRSRLTGQGPCRRSTSTSWLRTWACRTATCACWTPWCERPCLPGGCLQGCSAWSGNSRSRSCSTKPPALQVPMPYPSSIFIRERALIVNLESIKMLICMDQVWLACCRRLSPPCPP